MKPKPSTDNESRKRGSLQRILKEDSTTSNVLRNYDTLNSSLLPHVRSPKRITNLIKPHNAFLNYLNFVITDLQMAG